MLVWLASFPRSGNTFVRVLLKQLYGLSSYDLHEPHPPPRPQFNHVIGEAVLDVPPSELDRDDRLHIVKTHELPKEDHPAIYLVRDGRDAITSYARFLLHSGDRGSGVDYPDVLRRLICSSDSYGGWSGNVQAWTRRRTTTVIVRFDDLIADPFGQLRRAMAAVGLAPAEIATAKAPSFGDLHQLGPLFFARGRTGAWRDDLPAELHLLFWRRHGHAMRALGFTDAEPTADELAGSPLQNGEPLKFGIGEAGAMALRCGWGEAEPWGTWSVSQRASLQLSVGHHPPVRPQVNLRYRSFIEGGRALEVTCLAEGQWLLSWTCYPATWRGEQRIAIPSNLVGSNGILNLEFVISQPRSPAELDLSSDSRQLGIGIESLWLTEE
jgi:Sulfotransferase domain